MQKQRLSDCCDFTHEQLLGCCAIFEVTQTTLTLVEEF